MKFFIVLAAFVAVALCRPHDEYLVSVKQDTSGRYRVEYNIGEIERQEERMEDGSLRGFFTYIDGDGAHQRIEYLSGESGFTVKGTNLPMPPSPVQESEDVARARHEHLTIYEDIKSKLPPLREEEQH